MLRLSLFLLMGYACLGITHAQQDTFLVKPYLQFATQSSINILWETNTPSTTLVEYGEAQLDAENPNLEKNIELDGKRNLHEVKLDNLKLETKYLYRVTSVLENGNTLKSPVYTFRTAVRDEGAYFFALLGDSQYNGTTPWAWGKIAQKVWEDRPHFIIHAGDLVDTGTRKTDWTQHFFPYGHIIMSRYPMYTVLGNHEQDAQHYYDYMVNPDPEYYYTFTYGNAQFFMIDTNRDVHEGSEQFEWLEWELAKSKATWKFVVHHHPPYSSEENDHGDTYKGKSSYGTHARNLVPLYETYDVDFCLFGHTHVYERTWPIFKDQVNLQNGVVYINSGGAGGGLEDFDPTRSWFTQELQTGHHYCTFAVYDRTLIFKAIDHDGRLFDSFQMTKDAMDQMSLAQPPAPHIKMDKTIFQDHATVQMEALDASHKIVYTLDGSEPNMQSNDYKEELKIYETANLKARVYTPDGQASRVVERSFTKMEPQSAVSIRNTKSGLSYRYFEGSWNNIPDFSTLQPVRTGIAKSVNLTAFEHQEENIAVVLEGYLDISSTDTYQFYLTSDDGSKLFINDQELIDNDGLHGSKSLFGTTILEQGKHRIRIEFFQKGGGLDLGAGIVDPVLGKVPFSPGVLSH